MHALPFFIGIEAVSKMIKFSVVFVVLCLFTPNILGISEEMLELANMLHKTCQGNTGVAEEFIEAARKGDFKEEQSLKCYMKCLMTEMACMDDAGIIDVEAMIALMPDEMRDQVAPGIRACGTKIGKDPCDNAFQTHKCYYEQKPEIYFLI